MQPPLPLDLPTPHECFNLDYPNAELVFGVVFALGTEYKPVLDFLEDKVRLCGYSVQQLRISDWFQESADRLNLHLEMPDTPEHERIKSRIDAGRKIAAKTDRKDIFALVAASKIFTTRDSEAGGSKAHHRRAHIIVSLKRPEEVETLRRIYGPGFFLIGIFAEEAERRGFLVERKALLPKEAEELIQIDQKESSERFGQRTRDTFQMADVFVSVAGKRYESGIERFLRVVFGDPFTTPSRDEHAMFLASAASLRSGDLARQVGAALACAGGEVISLGCNDVPAPGGGLYCADHPSDQRDYKLKEDSNDKRKKEIIEDIVRAFRNRFKERTDIEAILDEARPLLRDTLLADVTEFGRSVHAEMDALIAAGRNGVSFRGSTLYTTTFPCHNCTRHIIAAGVSRVVYIEPYPKSLARELHSDAIVITSDRKPDDVKIPFEPFMGIGPRRFFDLFSMKLSSGYAIDRKPGGVMVEWDARQDSKPRVPMTPTSYLEREELIHSTLNSVFATRENTQQDGNEIRLGSKERQRVLETRGADGTTGRKMARMEEGDSGTQLNTAEPEKR